MYEALFTVDSGALMSSVILLETSSSHVVLYDAIDVISFLFFNSVTTPFCFCNVNVLIMNLVFVSGFKLLASSMNSVSAIVSQLSEDSPLVRQSAFRIAALEIALLYLRA